MALSVEGASKVPLETDTLSLRCIENATSIIDYFLSAMY